MALSEASQTRASSLPPTARYPPPPRVIPNFHQQQPHLSYQDVHAHTQQDLNLTRMSHLNKFQQGETPAYPCMYTTGDTGYAGSMYSLDQTQHPHPMVRNRVLVGPSSSIVSLASNIPSGRLQQPHHYIPIDWAQPQQPHQLPYPSHTMHQTRHLSMPTVPLQNTGSKFTARQLLPVRVIGELTLYVPHREPFLGEGGSVHMFLLGNQVKHNVASDDSEQWTADITQLIEEEQLPNETSMPVLLHNNRVICGGPEVCLRYLAKKLGMHGIDHVQDAVIDRLMTDLGTWFNVQQAAVQATLTPGQFGGDAVTDYMQSRSHFYAEAEKLLSFYNRQSAKTRTHGPGVCRDPAGRRVFFLGEDDSIADYFLFSLLDDDQRIAEFMQTSRTHAHKNADGRTSTSSQHPSTASSNETHLVDPSPPTQNSHISGSNPNDGDTEQTNAHVIVPMHFFDNCPMLHALYATILSLPLIQEVLLSAVMQTSEYGQNIPEEDEGKQQHTKSQFAVATQASTVASMGDVNPTQMSPFETQTLWAANSAFPVSSMFFPSATPAPPQIVNNLSQTYNSRPVPRTIEAHNSHMHGFTTAPDHLSRSLAYTQQSQEYSMYTQQQMPSAVYPQQEMRPGMYGQHQMPQQFGGGFLAQAPSSTLYQQEHSDGYSLRAHPLQFVRQREDSAILKQHAPTPSNNQQAAQGQGVPCAVAPRLQQQQTSAVYEPPQQQQTSAVYLQPQQPSGVYSQQQQQQISRVYAQLPQQQQPSAVYTQSPQQQQPSAVYMQSPQQQQPSAVYTQSPQQQQPSTVYTQSPQQQQPSTVYTQSPQQQQPSAVYGQPPQQQQQPSAVYAQSPQQQQQPSGVYTQVPQQQQLSGVYTQPPQLSGGYAQPQRQQQLSGYTQQPQQQQQTSAGCVQRIGTSEGTASGEAE